MVVVIEEHPQEVISSPNITTDNNSNNKEDNQVSDNEEEPETSKDVSDGFETASDNVHSDSETDLPLETRPQHPQSVSNAESFDDALDDDQLKEKALAQANDAKMEGNELFRDSKYEDALSKYEFALQVAPDMPTSVDLRSICHLNSAVCFFKLGKYDETVKECSKALELNPKYIKALFKRGEGNEKLERYEEAISDMKNILEVDPSNHEARRNIVRLEPLARAKMEKMKEEMMGKLKEMGNSILGRFGMSVDNFKTVKDPNTGSYSIQLQR